MPKPSTIVATVASLMNDTAQTQYTNTVVLPYLNLSLNILQEIFELNSIPVTHMTSATITVESGTAKIGYDTNPALPSELIEIQQLWESTERLEQWTPVTKRDFIPRYLYNNTQIGQFLIYAWKNDHIEVIPANADNDLKIDYIGSIFKTPIVIGDINVNLAFTNIQTYLEFTTAALCAMFIAENENRAIALSSLGNDALSRSLGIPIKGMQSIITRRRPFRASFKRRGLSF